MMKNDDSLLFNITIKKMNRLLDEIKDGGVQLAVNVNRMNEVFYCWAEYLSILSSQRNIKSGAKRMHYIPQMHLANFGVATSNGNHSLRSMRFHDSAFIGEALFLEKDVRYTKSDKIFFGKFAFPPHMEEVFARIETMVSTYLREYIKVEISSTPKPIEQVETEQAGFSKMLDRVDFKLLLSTYIIMCNFKFAYPGKIHHDKIYSLFQDRVKLRNMIVSIFYRRWIFAYASGGAELSLASRAVIEFPETGDGFFLSISRFWGLWVVSTDDTQSILDMVASAKNGNNRVTLGRAYIHDVKKPVLELGETLGRKFNKYMYDNHSGREIELFYPFAEKLEFHPDIDLKTFRSVSKSTRYRRMDAS